jgi:CheY-like chemotaxis protein
MSKIKVLMVDDEEQFRETTKKVLNKKGFETILAASGEEAIDRLKDNPDVVILDIKMPGIDGHEALRQIKKLKPDIPIIMLTGHGAIPSAREALSEGAYDYLSKPCDVDLLASKINDAYRDREKGPREEKGVSEVMVPIGDYTTLNENQTVKEAVLTLKDSFSSIVATSRIMEATHRSILVFDDSGNLKGILVIGDVLKAMMPAYLTAAKPSTADSIEYSPMFWSGMFSRQVEGLAKKKIKELMSPAPPTIDGDANLMEAASMMIDKKISRLAVTRKGDVVGVIREQDLFFEMERILRVE